MNPNLKISIFADGAKESEMLSLYRKGLVKGFTTNPTLMAQAGVKDYEAFSKALLSVITDCPISFEVFSDDFATMQTQALKMASWASNVNVKIPITNTLGEPALPLIRTLLDKNLKLNVTAILTIGQLLGLREILKPADDVIVSVFAGRIADTGVDPIPLMKRAVEIFKDLPKAKILWASPREILNLYQAEECGCHIITMTESLISKIPLYQRSLEDFSLDTVKMFYKDAQQAGFQL